MSQNEATIDPATAPTGAAPAATGRGAHANAGQNKLTCSNVWKVFGENAERALQRYGGHMSQDQLAAEGLVGAVQDVSLDIRQGEIFIIMGLSGSGKSTLVRCMSGLIPITGGHIFVEDQDLNGISAQQLMELRRHKMGMVFQHFALLPHLTVLANVAFPLEIQGVDKRTREQKARETIRMVGLEGREHNFPRQLSGGQQQRVGIARALVIEPDIWFLDEPFSALDPLIRRDMQDEFLRLQNMLDKTVVFITHDFSEAIKLADRIAIMHDGRVDQIGTSEELVTQPATDYVAEFTKDVPRAKVLSARSVMVPGRADGIPGSSPDDVKPVSAAERVEDFASRVVDRNAPVPVVDDQGAALGHVHPESVMNILLEREQRS
ncbi:glycine betaine/proline transport system ATP-binding protein [Limimonas halophila]|uniref:Trimethylamine N-oxide transport system ATP-binding protein TmoW n=1 Tax=Limimonas halophila TaxID=1082479 RepID=A0A1G7LJZ9_9PROT|nr:ATP-binding cassette domain-containing protein [Limimonas halophila]SDF49761.1 glycine betaine/proline transport system ATP-binding protein [Limimonas halophila]